MNKIIILLFCFLLTGCSNNPKIEKITSDNIQYDINREIEKNGDEEGSFIIEIGGKELYFINYNFNDEKESKFEFEYVNKTKEFEIIISYDVMKNEAQSMMKEEIKYYKIDYSHINSIFILKDKNKVEIPYKYLIVDLAY